MYDGLGVQWASSIPAFLALACVPFPFLFYKYGPTIRRRCKFAGESEAFMARIRSQGQQRAASEDISEVEKEDHDVEKETERRESSLCGPALEEAEEEAEALEYSTIDEPRFAPIHFTPSNLPASYDADPYDIDRVNTRESFGPTRSRASSVSSRRSRGLSLATAKSQHSGKSR